MSSTLHTSFLHLQTPSPCSNPCCSIPLSQMAAVLSRISIYPRHLRRRRGITALSVALRGDAAIWTAASLSKVTVAGDSLFHLAVDVSDSGDLASSYTHAGQYLQIRLPDAGRPSFMAIASPPSISWERGVFEFLVKSVPGSTAEMLCRLSKGDCVELSPVMGSGFDMEQISPSDKYGTVLIFATGTGISPIRALIESGIDADKRRDVRLYYGARNLRRMAYQDRFETWESLGVNVIPVLSRPEDGWSGERGYIQAAFARKNQVFDQPSVGAVLCGQRQMSEEVVSILTSSGVPMTKILKNF